MTLSLMVQQRVAQEITDFMREYGDEGPLLAQDKRLLGALVEDIVREEGTEKGGFVLNYFYNEPVHLFNLSGQHHVSFMISPNNFQLQHAPLM